MFTSLSKSNFFYNTYYAFAIVLNAEIPPEKIQLNIFIHIYFFFHRYAGVEEAMLRGTISFPRLETELRSEALVNYSPNKAYLQISSAATIHGNSISKRVLLRYGRGKNMIHIHNL